MEENLKKLLNASLAGITNDETGYRNSLNLAVSTVSLSLDVINMACKELKEKLKDTDFSFEEFLNRYKFNFKEKIYGYRDINEDEQKFCDMLEIACKDEVRKYNETLMLEMKDYKSEYSEQDIKDIIDNLINEDPDFQEKTFSDEMKKDIFRKTQISLERNCSFIDKDENCNDIYEFKDPFDIHNAVSWNIRDTIIEYAIDDRIDNMKERKTIEDYKDIIDEKFEESILSDCKNADTYRDQIDDVLDMTSNIYTDNEVYSINGKCYFYDDADILEKINDTIDYFEFKEEDRMTQKMFDKIDEELEDEDPVLSLF